MACLLAFLCIPTHSTRAAETVSPVEGLWTWSFTMPDGAVVKPQLQLKLVDGALTGTNSFRPGTAVAITNATLDGDQISFQVVRERDGQATTTRYSGKVADGRITGKIESNWNGEPHNYAWEAVHQNKNLEGRWQWGNRAAEIQFEKGQVKGKVILEDGEYPFRKSGLAAGEVFFEIERQRDGEPYINIFRARLQDGLLKGRIERIFQGQTNANDWEARRKSP